MNYNASYGILLAVSKFFLNSQRGTANRSRDKTLNSLKK